MSEERIPKRSEVAKENTWALEDIFPTDEAWEAALEEFKKLPERVAAYKGRLGESADTLLEFLKLSDDISVAADSIVNYAQRKSDEDTAVAKYQGYVGQMMNVFVAFNAASSFESPELISIPDDVLEGFYKQNSGLELYRRQLDRIRLRKDHVLSEAEERIIALAGEMGNSADKIYSMFSDADLKFEDAVDSEGKTHQVTHGSYIPLVKSTDRELRKSAFASIYKGYGNFRNTCAATLDSQMKALEFYTKARNYNSALEGSLSSNEVPVEVYHNLIKAVHDNINYMYDYVALRKKLLGVDELHFYDLYTPIVSDFTMKVTFEEAKETVLKALAPMGEDYIAILKEGFENRWIDVYENENKASGAYSAGARVHPFVMLNHKDTLDCMFTLAHEMGHAIHSYLSNKNQPVVYSDYVIFVAEVASTCNEALLMQYLLAHTDDRKEKAYLINYFLEQFRTTLYRQTMFAEFELKCSEICASGDTLTADKLCEIYGDLNKLYFGDGIVMDEDIKMEWARIPHFYYNFYVYQYATGYSAAIALSQRILKEGAPAVKDYIEGFLMGGCSADPITLLKRAGVDMSTTKPVTDALALFGDLIKQMDELGQ
ncbi:oligoendopeptidase F [Ruminococcus albus]|uniref:Oligopeptidase F n=1 Tax=Ruminococcus albus (strain ATCC 27210 / DSM 20455 / JCM 14654 / NCDO 2250 / 7) TaxID=697329 RepID=E6UDH3_RUMA7|nr:oligoendopeptidase F [Ruminococcus albus]ADU22856.1 oligoendopeptidase F [Ruminococcus albus 7 = DSM 20455]